MSNRKQIHPVKMADQDLFDWNGSFVVVIPKQLIDGFLAERVRDDGLWDRCIRVIGGAGNIFPVAKGQLILKSEGIVLDRHTDMIVESATSFQVFGHYSARRVYEKVTFPLKRRLKPCNKKGYDTHGQAHRHFTINAARYGWKDLHQRPYKCESCGKWHMTSMTRTEFKISMGAGDNPSPDTGV